MSGIAFAHLFCIDLFFAGSLHLMMASPLSTAQGDNPVFRFRSRNEIFSRPLFLQTMTLVSRRVLNRACCNLVYIDLFLSTCRHRSCFRKAFSPFSAVEHSYCRQQPTTIAKVAAIPNRCSKLLVYYWRSLCFDVPRKSAYNLMLTSQFHFTMSKHQEDGGTTTVTAITTDTLAKAKQNSDLSSSPASKKMKFTENGNQTLEPSKNNITDAEPKEKKGKNKRTWNSKNESTSQAAHAGSYANPELRALLGIELPPDDNGSDEDDAVKRVKRKVVFLLGYLGTGYSGFQMNDGQRTLQAEFELALLQTKMLNRQNFGMPHKYSWSTSGRTDKGVHACAQVVSCKIELAPDQTMDQVREELNQVLPPHFRVLDAMRATRSFCAKTQRDRVRYQYMIPSFVFYDIDKLKKLFEEAGCPSNGRDTNDPLSQEELDFIRPHLMNYRASEIQLELLRSALKVYEGTHSFHNFSKGVKADEARASRYIVSFDAQDPMLFENGMEWIPTQVVGQSFLIHQIRKMIAMAIDVVRGAAPLDTIARALDPESNLRLNPAPAQGLFLEMSFYQGYNRRKVQNQELKDIDWDNTAKPTYARWNEFRNKCVMSHISDEEKRAGNFIKHLYVQEFIFDYKHFYQLDDVYKQKEE